METLSPRREGEGDNLSLLNVRRSLGRFKRSSPPICSPIAFESIKEEGRSRVFVFNSLIIKEKERERERGGKTWKPLNSERELRSDSTISNKGKQGR